MPGEDDPKDIISEDILIVDEISMVGVDTMSAIMMALEMNKRANIVFVGDANQLPSISPGNFLNDMMKADCANVVVLDQIHRQDENSYISLIANQISKGKVTKIPDNATDIEWEDVNGDSFEETIKEAVTEYLQDGKDIDDLQIISPMKKGSCGVNTANKIMQEMMSDINGTQEQVLEIGFNKFHIGDRVIQLENNYDKEVFNGDMGVIIDLGRDVVGDDSDKEEAFIKVSFYGDERLYVGDEIEQLKVAWCITVHKYQGSQSPYVMFIMASEAEIMMSKELVYTAFTRAEKFLNVYGSKNMLQVAPTKSVVKKRYTNMNKIIQELKTGEKLMKVL
jgi:exodeoxyribonuclease V alpha subunit